jgi:hypothetical protein
MLATNCNSYIVLSRAKASVTIFACVNLIFQLIISVPHYVTIALITLHFKITFYTVV